MKKYIYIYKSELMSTLQYVLNVVFKLASFVILIFIFMNLWDYIYENPNELINGYSKNQMIWYVIVTEIIISAAEGRKFCRRISEDVKGGNIAYMMNKPYSYISYALSSHLGETTIKTVIAVVVGFIMGLLFLGETPVLSFPAVLIVLLSGLLAILINMLFTIFIGLISFIIEDSTPIHWLYSKSLLILGALFPVEFFPGVLAVIIKYSPIYVTCYGPAKLFVDFNYLNAIEILAFQIGYLLIAWALCHALYKKGVKKLNVTGG